MGVIFGDKIQAFWIDRLKDPLVYNILTTKNKEFLSQGLTNISTIPFLISYNKSFGFYQYLPGDKIILPPIILNPEVSYKNLLYECVVIYALIDKILLKKNKGYHNISCVDVCQSINNYNIIALAKTGWPHLVSFHILITNEFKDLS